MDAHRHISMFLMFMHGLPHHHADVPFSLFILIVTVMDQTYKDIELLLKKLGQEFGIGIETDDLCSSLVTMSGSLRKCWRINIENSS
ncbi:hypothetical protein Lal_00041882 [Lupinus albus]|nr:hypothetical protein Lal_00041882 [Lupinus albus]